MNSNNNIFIKTINKIASQNKIEMEPEDYIKDGLIYCGRCKTKRQTRVDLGTGAGLKIYPCQCECRAQEYEKEKEKRNAQARLESMRRVGFPAAEMQNIRFNNVTDCQIIQTAKKYADNFYNYFLPQGKGLLLWGPQSRGKTYAAACIVNELIEKGTPALLTDFNRIFNELDAGWDRRQEIIDRLAQFKLLAIDDLGAEKDSEKKSGYIYSIINSRVAQNLPLIITTNLDLQEILKPETSAQARIYERIISSCAPVKVDGINWRKQEMINSQVEINSILGIGGKENG